MSDFAYMFRSTDQDAPVLSGQNGALLSVLDWGLVDGSAPVAITSMTRSGSIVSVTTGTNHGFEVVGGPDGHGPVCEIAGAAQAEYNGKWRVATVTGAASFTFDIGSATPASPATGTINVKRAAAGWTKPYTASNKAVYRAASGNQFFLRIDDSAPAVTTARQAQAHGYAAMSDVDTGTDKFPNNSSGMGATKSVTTDSVARPWVLFCDDAALYLFVEFSFNIWAPSLSFGEAPSFKPGDAYPGFITGCEITTSNSVAALNSHSFNSLTSALTGYYANHHLCRSYSQTGAAITFGKSADVMNAGNFGASGGITYPSPVDNGFYAVKLRINESPGVFRGVLPGVYCPIHNKPLGDFGPVSGIVGLPGRVLVEKHLQSSNNGTATAAPAFDITGPWR